MTFWVPPDPAYPFSATSFTSLPVPELPDGHYLVTVYANAIPSVSGFCRVGEAPSPKYGSTGPLFLLLED